MTVSSRVHAVTILVASPRDHYKTFIKYSVTDSLRYLPVWTLEELQQVADMYRLSKEVIQERYCLIGGIARYVLEKPERLESLITNSVGRLKIDQLH